MEKNKSNKEKFTPETDMPAWTVEGLRTLYRSSAGTRVRGLRAPKKIVNTEKLKKNLSYLKRLFAVKEAFLILLGVASATLGLKGFLLPNNFLDGGVTGISLLISALTQMNLSVLIILINIPFILLAYKNISFLFSLKTTLAIFLLSFLVHYIDFPTLTQDKLLISIFGGFFLGSGIGLCMRGGCVIDGTEVLAIYISKISSLSVGDGILFFNVIIFSTAALLFDIEVAMYALLTYFATSKMVDFIVYGIEEYVSLMVVSDYSGYLKEKINKSSGDTQLTVIKGKKGNSEEEIDIIYVVVPRLELTKLKNEIAYIDPEAFIIESTLSDIKGGQVHKKKFY